MSNKMSTTTKKPSVWSDQEKVQLLTSIIAASGGPEWNKVNLPAGRTLSACKQLYYAIMRDKNLVLSTNGESTESSKKTGRASKQTATSTPSKRKQSMLEEQIFGDGSDNEDFKKQRKAEDTDSEDKGDKIKTEED
ncbi:MAG: hypothetical protein LQ342_006254 [Letrouitia transgressa]|nr:MAG: hypothetical protein LQ342_006254 [Letrouitia transgressa]